MKANLTTKAAGTASGPHGDAQGGVLRRQEIIGGPDAVVTSRECDTYRWRVRHINGEQSVYVEIAWALALTPEELEEPLRSAVESKGEVSLLEMLAEDVIPHRIRMSAAGVFVVDVDGLEGFI